MLCIIQIRSHTRSRARERGETLRQAYVVSMTVAPKLAQHINPAQEPWRFGRIAKRHRSLLCWQMRNRNLKRWQLSHKLRDAAALSQGLARRTNMTLR